MKEKTGFTLSEVVITMIIIGVITALTMPMLHNNASDKKWNVARQKAQSTIGEAFKLMTVSGEITDKLTTAEFAEKIIPRYLKVEKLCGTGAEGAVKCGFKTTVKSANGANVNLPYTWSTSSNAYAVTGNPTNGSYQTSSPTNNLTVKNYNNSYFFRTLDGFSVNFFYNPYCGTGFNDKNFQGKGWYSLDRICLMGVYDMNGSRGPNKAGADIGFIGSFYNSYTTKSSAVLPYNKEIRTRFFSNPNYCKNIDKYNNWKLPSEEDAMLLFLNSLLVRGSIAAASDSSSSFFSGKIENFTSNNQRWVRTVFNTPNYTGGLVGSAAESIYASIRCVRTNTLK